MSYYTLISIMPKTAAIVLDPNAQAFITAAGITDPTQQTAINNLVIGLKADGIWTKMKALYPFVGGTATSHKYNLKDPRDLDFAFRLSFFGGWTHTSNGIIPNGLNSHADTFYVPSVNNNSTDYSSISFYSRTNSISASPDSQVDMGATQFAGITGAFILVASFNSAGQSASVQSDFPNAFPYNYWSAAGANSITTGFYLGSADNNNIYIYKNNVLLGQNTTLKSTTRTSPTIPVYIGADNYNGGARRYSFKNLAFAHIGASLNSTESANLYARVQSFETTLGRQV